MSPHTLIVIDMQPGFSPNHPKLISNVSEEINLAKANNAGIIFLEYWRKMFNGDIDNTFKDTLPELLSLVDGYDKVERVKKFECSGEMAICDFLNSHPEYNRENFVICGIYVDQCVYQTVNDLHNRLPTINIEIPIGACWSPHRDYYRTKKEYDARHRELDGPFGDPFYFYPKDRISYK